MWQLKIDFLTEFPKALPSQWQIIIHYSETPACERPCNHACIQYMYTCMFGHSAVQHEWWWLLQSPRAAPRCSSPPWSVPISPVLLQHRSSLTRSEIPNFSSRSLPDRRMQTSGILDRLKFSQSMCSTAYWFSSLSLYLFYILWLYVKLWAWQKKVKPALFIARASMVDVFSLLYCDTYILYRGSLAGVFLCKHSY